MKTKHPPFAGAQNRRIRKMRAQQAAAIAAIDATRNAGRDYFKQSPNLMLIEVSRHASAHYDHNDQIIAFIQGYSQARIHHDDYNRGE